MYFSSDFLTELKEKVDMVLLVSEYTALHKIGSHTFQGRCPNPDHSDSSPSFRVFKKGYKNGKLINNYDTWACMGCHVGSKGHGNLGSDCIAFYQWIEKCNWYTAVTSLCDKFNIPIPSSEFDKLFKEKRKQSECYRSNMCMESLRCLYDRGLSDEDIESWKIGYNGKIVFPLMDRQKNVIGFTKRWMVVPEGRNDKYKNSATSKIFNKSSYFYGIHNLSNECDEIRITEGPMDAIMAHKYGAKNVVATLGTAFTDSHVEVIKALGKIPVLILDGDERGIDAIKRAVNKLAEAGVYCKLLIIPDNKDLCELAMECKETIEEYIADNAITYGMFIVKDVVNKYESAVNEFKVKYFNKIKTVIEEIPLESEREIIKQYILDKMNIKIGE